MLGPCGPFVPTPLSGSSGGGGTSGIDVEDEGTPLPANPYTTLNFIGAGVTATDGGGGVADITIPGSTPSYPVLEAAGVPLAGAPHDTYDYTGFGVVLNDAGGGVADIIIPGIEVYNQGSPIIGAPHYTHDFVGNGVVASNAGGAVATITIPGITLQDEGTPTAGAPHTVFNFVGSGVTVANAGGGTATITIPGSTTTDQTFAYTVTGAEPDLSDLVIALPAARASTNYAVFPAQGTLSFHLLMAVANSSRTTTQFVLSLSGDATTGDVFWFTVRDL